MSGGLEKPRNLMKKKKRPRGRGEQKNKDSVQ